MQSCGMVEILFLKQDKEESGMNKTKSIVLGFAPAWVPILSIILCGFLFKILGI